MSLCKALKIPSLYSIEYSHNHILYGTWRKNWNTYGPTTLFFTHIKASQGRISRQPRIIVATVLFQGLCPALPVRPFLRETSLFIPEESETQREEIICLKSHSCQVAQLGFHLSPAGVGRAPTSPPPPPLLLPPPESCGASKQVGSYSICRYLGKQAAGTFSFPRDLPRSLWGEEVGRML